MNTTTTTATAAAADIFAPAPAAPRSITGRLVSGLDALDELERMGGTIHDQTRAAVNGWHAFCRAQTAPDPAADDLAAAILNGADPEDMTATARAAAAHHRLGAEDYAAVREAVARKVLPRLRTLVATHDGPENAATARDAFRQAAARFTAAAEIVDPRTPAADLIDGTARTRKAWTDGQTIAGELNAALYRLELAARVNGQHLDGPALVTDPDAVHGLDARALWEAWEAPDPVDRWAGLWALGLDLDAPDWADTHATTRRPLDPVTSWAPREDDEFRGVLHRTDTDPETAEDRPPLVSRTARTK